MARRLVDKAVGSARGETAADRTARCAASPRRASKPRARRTGLSFRGKVFLAAVLGCAAFWAAATAIVVFTSRP